MVTIRSSMRRGDIKALEATFAEIGSKRAPRAVQYALNGVAKSAQSKTKGMLQSELDNPTAWTLRAYVAKYGKLSEAQGKALDELSSELTVREQQSAPFKYMYGDGANRRRPGDVGPAQEDILLAIWPNVKRMGIRPTAKGNMPRTAIKKLFERRDTFWGHFRWGGKTMPIGLYLRPERRVDPRTGKRFNLGVPRLLLRAVPKTIHDPILEKPTQKLALKAMAELPMRVENEMRSEIGRMGARAKKAGGRF